MRPTFTAEEILGSRSRVRVLRALRAVRVPLNATQVARLTGLSRPAVTEALRQLAAPGIVSSAPVGPANVYWLRRENAYVQRFVDPVFAAERDLPALLIDDLREEFENSAESGVLFGSYARGEQSAESDVDVLLVVSDEGSKLEVDQQATDYASGFLDRFGATLGVLVYTRPEAAALFRTAPHLTDSLIQDGILLFGREPREWSEDESGEDAGGRPPNGDAFISESG